jgi:hypothetical protein
MIRRWLAWVALVWLGLSGSAQADTAKVMSGEHGDFTRLVIDLPGMSSWTVGRTAIGYAFAVQGADQPPYDLRQVWDRIPRTRLQSLRVDPETGALNLTLACDCHVFPFEYRPGMVVLDIKDGLAPAGSAFEAAFALGKQDEPTSAADLKGPKGAIQSYSWLDRIDAIALTAKKEPDLSLNTGSSSLALLRDALLLQISRGAAQGVVDMALPGPAPAADTTEADPFAWTQIRIGDLPGLDIVEPQQSGDLPPDGVCFPPDLVDLPSWGAEKPPSDLLAEARSGLYGEFDRIDESALLEAVKLHLFLGFGAEAAQFMTLQDDPAEPDWLAPYRSMALIVDGLGDPGSSFAGMLGCSGPASLWAALAVDRLPARPRDGPWINTDAILQSFAALPPHLRQSLGPTLAVKFLELDDAASAEIIRNAVERSPYGSKAELALLDAKVDLQADRTAAARAHAELSVAEPRPHLDGLMALVEAHFRDLEPLSPEVANALMAFERDAEDDKVARDIQRSVVLALALSEQTDPAFALAKDSGLNSADLWRVTAQRSTDDAFLRHAVIGAADPKPVAEKDVALAIATRLTDLGFADAALLWLGPIDPSADPVRRRVAAKAEMLRGDALETLELLQGLASPEDERLRAQAFVQLGRLGAAREAFEAAGLPEDAARLLAWERDWAAIDAQGANPWAGAASAAEPPPVSEGGPLSRGTALVDESAATRAKLEALLAAVDTPIP